MHTTCNSALIVRCWYEIEQYRVTPDGHCPDCRAKIAGRFEKFSTAFGARRIPVVMSAPWRESNYSGHIAHSEKEKIMSSIWRSILLFIGIVLFIGVLGFIFVH